MRIKPKADLLAAVAMGLLTTTCPKPEPVNQFKAAEVLGEYPEIKNLRADVRNLSICINNFSNENNAPCKMEDKKFSCPSSQFNHLTVSTAHVRDLSWGHLDYAKPQGIDINTDEFTVYDYNQDGYIDYLATGIHNYSAPLGQRSLMVTEISYEADYQEGTYYQNTHSEGTDLNTGKTFEIPMPQLDPPLFKKYPKIEKGGFSPAQKLYQELVRELVMDACPQLIDQSQTY